MPIYVFICGDCGHRMDQFRRMNARNDSPQCEECGGNTERSIADEQKEASGHVFEEYVDYNLTDDPKGVYVDSKRTKERLKEEQGVIEVGDVS